MKFDYDVIVIGAGHAGCEAATAAAKLGAATLLVTKDMNRIAQMSCNPAVGGIAKGQIVREIDALGGQMGIIADRTAIQFRMLNRSKGPAVWSPRVQSDRTKFTDEWRKSLDATPGLNIFQDTVESLLFEESLPGSSPRYTVVGCRTALGFEFRAKQVVLTAGTFLNGLMHFGAMQIPGGRIAEDSSTTLSRQLAELGFKQDRMKTGTPARIDGRTIDFSKAQRQEGDNKPHEKFSFLPEVKRTLKERPCWIVHTNPEAHGVMRDHLDESPLYNGQIQSIGPRYCPSIETKLVTFADKQSHQLFLEPEGETTEEYYINGFSSSMPWQVQVEALSHVPALKDVQFYRPGYAIEYDFFDPTQLRHTLETKLVGGLFFAGQVNGTTGYEEAAAQGLMAGINAARRAKGEDAFTLRRDQAYIGVLIDDLVTKGVDEPYRMFTSRAEYRILLRQDDADMRLTPIGYEIGLATPERHAVMLRKREQRDALLAFLTELPIKANAETNTWLDEKGSARIATTVRAIELVRRPGIGIRDLSKISNEMLIRLDSLDDDLREEIVDAAEILIKYEGYIKRERELADKTGRLDHVRIPVGFDYSALTSLSTESRQKLDRIRPETIGQASRIPGVSPADINILLLFIR